MHPRLALFDLSRKGTQSKSRGHWEECPRYKSRSALKNRRPLTPQRVLLETTPPLTRLPLLIQEGSLCCRATPLLAGGAYILFNVRARHWGGRPKKQCLCHPQRIQGAEHREIALG